MCHDCNNALPHHGARFNMSCIGCYARWLVHKHNGDKRLIWNEIKSDKRYDVDALTNEVRKVLSKNDRRN